MSLLDDLLDARLDESFRSALHPHVPHGAKGGQFAKKGASSIAPARTKAHTLSPHLPEGSGASKPTGQVSSRPQRPTPRAPGTGPEAPTRGGSGNQRKLGEHELPAAVGKGPWSRKVDKTVKGLQSGEHVDTEQAHRAQLAGGGLGHYSPERTALHARIASALLQGAGSHPGKAEALFLAGGPASGKSSLVKHGHVKLPPNAVDVNPDIVRTMLPEYGKLVAAGDTAAAAKTHEEASHVSKLVMNIALARHHHVIVDSVGDSGPGSFAKKIKAAAGAGHKVRVAYATLDTKVAEERALAREKRSGRKVPIGYLRSAHAAVSHIFKEDVSKLGVPIEVFDNGGKKPKRIYRQAPGQTDGEVFDRKSYAAFLAKARALPHG